MAACCGFAPEDCDTVFIILDKMDKIGLDGVAAELEKEGFAKEAIDRYIGLFEAVTPDTAGVRLCKEKLEGYLDSRYADELMGIMESVDSLKEADFRLVFDPTLVRGMSYYTGPIFEVSMDGFGGSVGGGGRYDEMIGKFTGQNVCACGFSIGFERIVMLLMERGFKVPGTKRKTALLVEKNMPADKLRTVLSEAKDLRDAGIQTTVAIMKKNKKFQKEQLAAEGYTEFKEYFTDRM